MRADQELIALCPIDGPLKKYKPQPFTASDLDVWRQRVADSLVAAGKAEWAEMVTKKLAGWSRERTFGDALALLLRHGPAGKINLRRQELEQLLVDVVATWPPRA